MRQPTTERWRGGAARRALGLVALVAAMMLVHPVHAAPAADAKAVAEATVHFRAGAEAFAAADYDAALQAFEAARALVPDPALTFSIAQAHRRQYHATDSSAHLRSAATEYRRYLVEVPKGGRRGDAAEALIELEPKLAELDAEAQESVAPARIATRLMVISSVEGAQVSIDDAPAEPAPFFGKVEAGTHVVTVTASGYSPYVRTIKLAPGEVISIDPKLDPLPAELIVRGADGGTLWIDGHVRGILPMTSPAAVEPGRRLVGVTRNGHRRFELEVQLDNGARKELDVALESSAQRTTSIATLTLAGASLVAGGVLAAIAGAIYEQHEETYEQYQSGRIDAQQLAEYDDGRDAHTPYTIAAIATGAAGVVLGVAGAVLYLVDEPAPPSQVGSSRPAAVRVGFAPVPSGAVVGVGAEF